MNPAILHTLALAVRVIGLVAFAILSVVAVRFLQRARRDMYYVMREEARNRGLRFLGMAVASLLVALGLACGADWLGNRSTRVARVTPTPTLAPTDTSVPPTPAPTLELPTDTPTPRPTATLLPVPTATPLPTRIPPTDLPPTLLTPIPSAVPAAETASFGPIQFGATFANFQLGGVGDVFPLNVRIVHATFLVRNMNGNAAWTAAWYREGKYVAGDPLLWTALPNTVAHVFFGPVGGYKPGKWELRTYIQDRLQQKATFTILSVTAAPTATHTPKPTTTAAP